MIRKHSIIEPEKFFNKLNNCHPFIILDVRNNLQEFDAKHLNGSFPIILNSPETIHDQLLSFHLFEPSTSPETPTIKSKHLIVLLPSSIDPGTSELIIYNVETLLEQLGIVILPPNCPTPADSTQTPMESPTATVFTGASSTPFQISCWALLNSDEFYQRYDSCLALFQTSDGPYNRFRARKVYYATEIIPNFLFLGDYANAIETSQLEALHITHVIDATNARTSQDPCEVVNAKYLPIDIHDVEKANIAKYFPQTNAFIHDAKTSCKSPRVLIHCRAGWSRSPSIVLAYLVQCENMTLLDAIRFVVKERPFVCPNEGFRKQLFLYEKEVRSSLGLKDYFLNKYEDSAGEVSDKSMKQADKDFFHVIRSESECWSFSENYESDFDRIPILALKNKAAYTVPLKEFPDENDLNSSTSKPKKPFLKRGELNKRLGLTPSISETQESGSISSEPSSADVPCSDKPPSLIYVS